MSEMRPFRNAELTSMRGSPLLLALSFIIATQALAQSSLSEKSDKNTVHGTVVNAVTQAPISRALVFTRDNRAAVLTDGEGHFEIPLPKDASTGGMVLNGPSPPRQYVRRGLSIFLSARKPGFLEDTSRPAFAASSGDDLTIALTPEAIIKGRIALASGDAALGINVQLYTREVMDGRPRWTQGQMARTNSSGEFRFAELHPGSYKLLTHESMDNDPVTNFPGSQQSGSQQSGSQRYGYPPVYFPGGSEFSAASTIELTAGQEFQADLSVTRQPYYRVRVPIANGGVGGLNVSVNGQHGPGYGLGYNNGEQRIEGLLPSGNYVVEASSFGQGAMSGSGAIRVAGAPVDGPTITMVPGGSVTLEVKDEFSDKGSGSGTYGSSGTWSDGKRTFALHGARLYLNASVESTDDFIQRRFSSIRQPNGSGDDNLVIENLLPGQYWLRLHTARGYIASATQGSTDVLHKPLTIGSGPAAPVEITVRDDMAELDGTVTALAQQSALSSEAGEPTQVWVYCVPLPESPGEMAQFVASGDGKFTNTRMTPGDYRVLAFYDSQPQLPYRDAEAMKPYESKGTVVHLSGGQKATVQVQTILSE